MKYLLPLLLTFCCLSSAAQNILTNGDFEYYTTCPNFTNMLNSCPGWQRYAGTPDAFNTCAATLSFTKVPNNFMGSQIPASGNGYMGLATGYNGTSTAGGEFAAVSFTPLTPGISYLLSMSVSLADTSGMGSDAISVYFYDAGPSLPLGQPPSVTPQISFSSSGPLINKTGWDRVGGIFKADSAYDNLVIGGFPNTQVTTVSFSGPNLSANSSYYYIDSVVLRPVDTLLLQFTQDTICGTDSFLVPYQVHGTTFYTGNVFTVQLSNASGSFTTAINIGSKTGTLSGTVKVGLPPTLPPGSGYRMRIISSYLPHTSADNGKNITIGITIPAKPVTTSTMPACTGSTLNLSATSTSTITAWQWKGPNGFSATVANPSIVNPVATVADTYIVKAYNYGCVAADTEIVTVYQTPAIPTASSNSPVCTNTPLSLFANTIAGVTYNWSGPSSFSSLLQNPIISNAMPANGGTYSVTATANGCTSAAGTTTVVVATPAASYTAGSNSPVCAGGTLNLNVGNISGAIWTWSGPNSFTSTTQNPTITPVPQNASGTYSVYATVNGCQYAPATTNVTVNNVSSLGVYPSPNDTLCINNANANFVAVPFNAGTAPQYQWYKNNNLIGGATNITYPATGIADGDSFYCRMTVTGLCADPLVLYSNKVGMTVLPLTSGPSVTITADPGTLLSPWQLVKFTAVASNAGTIPKYQWKRNGQDVIGATSDNWSANNLSNGDTISCVVTSDIWCALPASEVSNRMVVNIKTGITDIGADRKLELYPNPNNGSFIVNIPLAPLEGGNLRVDVVDVVGRTVYTDHLPIAVGTFITNSKLEVALPASVANGVYMLKLNADGVVYHARFTVSR